MSGSGMFAQPGSAGGDINTMPTGPAPDSSGGGMFATPGAPASGGGAGVGMPSSLRGGARPKSGSGGIGGYLSHQLDLGAHTIAGIAGGGWQMYKDSVKSFFQDLVGNHKGANKTFTKADQNFLDQSVGSAVTAPIAAAEHPGRNLTMDLLSLAPLLHVGGEVGFRGAAGAEAARSGGSVVDIAKAVARHPEPGPRTLSQPGGEPVVLHGSRNLGIRAFQNLHDLLVQGRMSENPEGLTARYGAGRMHAALMKNQFRARMRAAVANDLAASSREIKAFGKKNGISRSDSPQKLAALALRAVSENGIPEDRALQHESWAAQGIEPEANREIARIYRQIHEHGLTQLDENGRLQINAEDFPALAKVDEKILNGQTEVDRLLKQYGLMLPSSMQERIDLPNRVYTTGSPKEPVRGITPAHAGARMQVEQLQRALDKLNEKEAAAMEKRAAGVREASQRVGGKSVPLDNPYREKIVTVSHQLEAARERLARFEGKSPEPAPSREALHAAALNHMSQQRADDFIHLVDERAHQYARETGGSWQDYYKRFVGPIVEGGDVATNALFEHMFGWRDAQAALRSVDKGVFRQIGVKPSDLASLIAEGTPGRFWYEESAHEILNMAHGDKELADKIAQLVAIYSAQREPIPNMQLAINAYNEFLDKGRVESFGTKSQIQKANDILIHGKEWAGLKTDRFYANMLEDIDPEKYARMFPGGEVTNDIWMGRLFGLKTDTPTPREYEAMQTIVQRLADSLGWKPKQVQAALWIAKKARDEGTSIDEASTNFATALEREHGVVPFEAAPGRATAADAAAKYEQLPQEQKVAYTREKAQAVSEFLNDAKVFGRLGNEGPGVYEGHINPGWSVYVAASRGKGAEFALRVSLEGTAELDRVASAIGEALNQDAAAWFKPFIRKNIRPTQWNGLRLILGRVITDDEARALDEAFRSAGHDIAIVHEHDGAHLLNFSELKNKDFHRFVGQVAEATLPDLKGAQGFAFDGNYIERSDYAHRLGESGSGAGGRSDVFGPAFVRLQERSAEIDRRYFEEAQAREDAGRAGERRGNGGSAGRSELDRLTPLEERVAGEIRGAYDPESHAMHFAETATPDTFEHESLHAARQSLPEGMQRALLAHYAPGVGRWTRDAEESFVKDMMAARRGEKVAPIAQRAFRGLTSFESGRNFVPLHIEENAKQPKSAMASSGSKITGEPKSPISAKEATGRGIVKGMIPDNTVRLLADHMRRVYRFVNTAEFRNDVARTGAPVKRSSRDVLIRVREEPAGNVPPSIKQDLGITRSTLNELPGDALDHEAGFVAGMKAFVEDMIPGFGGKSISDLIPGHGDEPVASWEKRQEAGTKAPDGYVWVDSKVLGNANNMIPRVPNWLVRRVDDVNAAVTAATVYFKLGHVGTRFFTNATTNLIQGSMNPVQMGYAWRIWHDLSETDRRRAVGAAGTHYYESLPQEGQTIVGRTARFGANIWARFADQMFRFNSLTFEARKAGFSGTDGFKKFLNDLQNSHDLSFEERAKVEEVARRADRAAIAYDNISEFERNVLARAIWFYPWMKGSVVFTADTLFEHPYKALALGALGQTGAQAQQQELGNLPSYDKGLFEIGDPDALGRPLVADFSTFSPFSSTADLLELGNHGALSDFFNPVVGAAVNASKQLDQYGRPIKNPNPVNDLWNFLQQVVSATPEYQVGSAIDQSGKDQSNRQFPTNQGPIPGWLGGEALLRMILGPGTPRRINLQAAEKAYERQQAGR